MLEELRIQNFAIINELELELNPGLNVITGETGAGKSIIVDAVELLLGAKAETESIRTGADRAIVEGSIRLTDEARYAVEAILREAEFLEEGEELRYLLLGREIRRKGRSIGRINGVTVNVELLREVGEALVDIHGQSAHLSLLKPRTHIDLLDYFAGLLDQRDKLQDLSSELNAVRRDIHRLQEDKDTLRRRADLLRHEVDEIMGAELISGEDEELRFERTRLANSEQLATLATEVALLLNGDVDTDQMAIVDGLMHASSLLSKLAKIDHQLKRDYELLEGLSEQAQELGMTLASYSEEVEFDPERLTEVEERLELINSLKRRYDAETIEEIIEHGEESAKELDSIDHSEERLDQLRETEQDLLKKIGDVCQKLSKARKKAGDDLSKKVVNELQDLKMENTRFAVDMLQVESTNGCIVGKKRYSFDSTGMDKLEFLMSANPGEPPRPLSKVASGGEMARIMLALKRVLTEADQTPILIFDEVDQGIGGRIGAIVGEKLWSLSDGHQVLVVTHLPQLASYADKHYHVRKSSDTKKETTTTEVIALNDDEARIEEIAEMLGAHGESGKQSALGILEEARVRKMELTPD